MSIKVNADTSEKCVYSACNLTLSTWPKRSALFCSASSVASCVKYQGIWYPDDISMCPVGELEQVTTVGLKTHKGHRLVSKKSHFRLVRNACFQGDRNSKKPRRILKHLKRSSANIHEDLPLVLTCFPQKLRLKLASKEWHHIVVEDAAPASGLRTSKRYES